jgi:DNA topoisomerase-2
MPVSKEKSNDNSVENRYKKFTQIEHVLARPGMYVGDITTVTSEQWILEPKSEKIISKFVTWNPGIYKIFDEIITNASDECQRSKLVKNIKVNFKGNTISVQNDGSGIPIQIHKEHNIYVPELIFGNLLSSSNYDDSKKRTTGGLNGLGAKLTNIYSTEFIVETVNNKKMYRQVFKNNMSQIEKPEICDTTEKDYTKITFTPDFSKFKLKELNEKGHDTLEVLKKRVFDISAITPKTVSVFLNGEKIKCKDFSDYVSYYIGTKTESPRVYYEEPNGRWQVCIALSKKDSFQHVSFVNGISTIDGGSHVDHVTLPIMKKCTEEIQAKHKNITVKQQYVKDSLFVFINSIIDNPTFSSQTKDKHTTRVSEFGSKFTLTEDFTKKILKLGFVDSLLAVAEAKEKKSLSKTDGKKVVRLSIPKLDDANKAGTSESLKCTLILTEGDSAKTTAVSGLSVVGRDYFGVFPLRGKLLNTREASFSQISKNEEILNIKKILGLQTDTKTTKNLRYGKVLVMTDADYDGFHIKALLINFIDAGWPELLKNVFIGSIVTPIVKVSKGNERLSFYTHKEYMNWKQTDHSKGNWQIKYYKGLGTSTASEAREYFKNLKVLNYINKSSEDSNALVLAFKKTEADERKKWIKKNTEQFEGLDYNTKESVPVAQLVNKELVLFSISDNVRSIPSIVDGLKPGQRKVLFACFKKKLKTEIKVAQLAGYISEHTAYHHGEHSLQETIIKMAQNFVGSNNMNLLEPCGQFGTRILNGNDASSPRYIFTHLSKNSEQLFNSQDFPLLEYLNDDGQSIEPKFYVPTLPLILINGAEGIGTGFSTKIPSFNPDDLKFCLEKLVDDPDYEIPELTPWYRGFNGHIEKVEINKWVSYGSYVITDNMIKINEIPIGESIENYKQFLEKMEADDRIITFKNNSSDTKVNFEIKVSKETLNQWEYAGTLEKNLKLTSNINATNMYIFNEKGNLQKMDSAESILLSFFRIRNKYHILRKDYLTEQISKELVILESKVKFVRAIVNDELVVFKRKKQQITEDIKKMGLYENPNYDYLLNMPIHTFTEETIDKLEKEYSSKENEFKVIKNTTIKDLWKQDFKNIVS